VHSRVAIRGEDDDRRFAGLHGAKLVNRDLVVGTGIRAESRELLVRAIDFVDNDDGALRRRNASLAPVADA